MWSLDLALNHNFYIFHASNFIGIFFSLLLFFCCIVFYVIYCKKSCITTRQSNFPFIFRLLLSCALYLSIAIHCVFCFNKMGLFSPCRQNDYCKTFFNIFTVNATATATAFISLCFHSHTNHEIAIMFAVFECFEFVWTSVIMHTLFIRKSDNVCVFRCNICV